MARRVIVVGGGILGCSIASRLLAADPSAQVTVVDAGLVGSGASMLSAGLSFPVGRTERTRRLAAVSVDHYARAVAQDPGLPIYPVRLRVAVRPAARARAVEHCAGLLPDLDPSPHAGYDTWLLPGCHVADVPALVQRLARRLRERARLLEGVRVESIADHAGEVGIALSTGESTAADQVVLAPGPWVDEEPLRRFTAELGIRIKKVVALHVHRQTDAPEAGWFFPVEDLFLVPLPHREHWLLSYTCRQWDVSPASVNRAGLTAVELAEVRAVLDECAPRLTLDLAGGRVFCDAYAPEPEPIVRPVGRTGRIVFAGAANGSGYRLAPGIAAEVTELLG
jgi:glycine/D-amino acid oxidase-like deaminating enzyme